MDRSSRQKVIKDILEMNHALEGMDVTDLHTAFLPQTAQYPFYSGELRPQSRKIPSSLLPKDKTNL